jgi:hypothetical protein
MRLTPVVWILFLSTSACAQTSAPFEPNGIVTGRVFCGDTGQPARFAAVSLKPVPSNSKPSQPTASSSSTTINVDTSIDGTFTLDHIAPGRYYVIVRTEGYIEPSVMFTTEQLSDPSPPVRSLVKQALSEVFVEQNATVQIDIQIQRGAAISGTITYDDGTPASGISINVLNKNESGKWTRANFVGSFYTTDDRGHYRITSLLPDTYLIVSTLNLSSSRTNSSDNGRTYFERYYKSELSFYGDGKVHIEDATGLILRGEEERTGADAVIPLNKLHRLTGRVSIEPGRHFANAATIDLLYGDQKTVIAHDTISRNDGLFHFEFVPEGNYILSVTNARDITWDSLDPKVATRSFLPISPTDKERTLKTYGDAQIPLLVQGDMPDVIATVKPQQAKAAGPEDTQ